MRGGAPLIASPTVFGVCFLSFSLASSTSFIVLFRSLSRDILALFPLFGKSPSPWVCLLCACSVPSWLDVYQQYWSFQRNSFCFPWFSLFLILLISVLIVIIPLRCACFVFQVVFFLGVLSNTGDFGYRL